MTERTSSKPRPKRASPTTPAATTDGLADPRIVSILSTEHWSLLTARSLAYNEAFSRGGMFLTLLSASLVGLGLVYQGSGGGPEFPAVAIAILSVDLFVGLATLGRIATASIEEFRAMQAMNRIRHAYFEISPAVRTYFSTSGYDDADSALEVYGALPERPGMLLNALHGFTTMPGMIGVLNAVIAGALAGAITIALGGDMRLALIISVAGTLLTTAGLVIAMLRLFTSVSRFLEVRFPAPMADQ